MNRPVILWIIAFVITILSAYYQRITGPTYPENGVINFEGEEINFIFDRSHGGSGHHLVKINTMNASLKGELIWRRLNSNDEWNNVRMKMEEGTLSASIPNQPKAGKVIYKVKLISGKNFITIPGEPVIIRFKGEVPAWILIPHIIFIFSAMLFSTRTGLEYFNSWKNYKMLTKITFLLMILGGLIFGPLTQLYAFDALWTGFPFGYDLTDNKTLIAFIGWLIAIISIYKTSKPGRWIIFASIITLIIFLIPHSLLGSELNYAE